jgi:hypothetical protein
MTKTGGNRKTLPPARMPLFSTLIAAFAAWAA